MLKLYLISGVIFLFDRVTKLFIDLHLQYKEIIEYSSFLSIVYFKNEGAAFSFLSDAGGWQRYFLISVSIAAVIILPIILKKNQKNNIASLGLILIFAGALGNLYDRIFFGYVIDFLYFHIGDNYWPAFNIADSSICIGAGLLIYYSLRNKDGQIQ